MKKFLKCFGYCAFVLICGLSFAACGEEKSLVDTSGKYQSATFAETQVTLANIDTTQKVECYDFRLYIDGDMEGTKIDVNYQGKFDVLGNIMFDMDFHMEGNYNGSSSKIDQSGKMYFDATNNYYYFNNGDVKLKSLNFGESTNLFSFFKTILDFNKVYEDYFAQDTGGEYLISTSDDYTKIKLTMEDSLNDEIITANFYFIIDSNNNFVGFQFSTDMFEGTNILEFIPSTGVIKFPSDLDSYTETN